MHFGEAIWLAQSMCSYVTDHSVWPEKVLPQKHDELHQTLTLNILEQLAS